MTVVVDSQEKIEKDELRVGLPVFARGQQVTAWAKASEFSKALRFEVSKRNEVCVSQAISALTSMSDAFFLNNAFYYWSSDEG